LLLYNEKQTSYEIVSHDGLLRCLCGFCGSFW